jgi:bifunctional DNase/RNase
MIEVTVADVVKQKVMEKYPFSNYVIVLLDNTGKRALPIWVGRQDGESIAMALQNFVEWRPGTHSFYAGLLKSIKARVQEVRIETLREKVFYAIVKVKCGNNTGEVDARPSDGIALSLLTGCPIFATEEVLNFGGVDIPDISGKSITHSGVNSIIGDIEEIQRSSLDKLKKLTLEDVARAKAALINSVFNN